MPNKRYSQGLKYCPRCGNYWATDSIRCPKHGITLRTHARHGKNKSGVKYIEVQVD